MMQRDFDPRDWKVYGRLYPVIYERAVAGILADVRKLVEDAGRPAEDRYRELWDLLKPRDKDLRLVFERYSRSTAFFTVLAWQSRGLLKPEELSEFSDEVQVMVRRAEEFRRS